MSDGPPPLLTRRRLLGAVGLGTLAVAGGAVLIERSGPAAPAVTVGSWAASRGERYLVAHRGAGDVLPEHTVPAYDGALAWGATAMEISASSTSDGVLVCMHDLTYDRTTNLTGAIHDRPSSVLERAGVLQPALGPRWATPPLTPVPRLTDVLARYGGRAVLCVEAKRDADFPTVLALVDQHGLRDSVVVKLSHASSHLADAKSAGYPVFAYLTSDRVDPAAIADLAARLDPARDYLGIPTSVGSVRIPEVLVRLAVATGIPVWVYAVHRRSQADWYFSRGVEGAVASSIGYGRAVVAPARTDAWGSGAVVPGELTREPATTMWAPAWGAGGVLGLAVAGRQHVLTLGQCAPLPSGGRRFGVELDVRWTALPTASAGGGLFLAVGHADDRYYQAGLGSALGYQALLAADGSLGLFAHSSASPVESPLAASVLGGPITAGTWIRLRLEVSASSLTFSRQDGATVVTTSADDARFRGDYLHVGRSTLDGAIELRGLHITGS